MEAPTRTVTVFSAGCPVCEKAIAEVRERACPRCEVEVVDLHAPDGAERARALEIGSLPAVAIDGELARCCRDVGLDMATLEEAGLGRPPV